MALIPQFPGMNPYLESPYRWPEIHIWLIVELARTLNPQLKPKYRAAVETRIYTDSVLIGIADAAVFEKPNSASKGTKSVAIAAKPERVTVPMMSEVTERYLEIRERETQRVLTVIEVLSPANKRAGQGRKKYLEKHQNIFDSSTHLVEIDLLRQGDPMPLCEEQKTAYQILVSKARDRPIADRYAFDLQEPIPIFSSTIAETVRRRFSMGTVFSMNTLSSPSPSRTTQAESAGSEAPRSVGRSVGCIESAAKRR